MGYKGLKRIQGITMGCKWLHTVTQGYKGLQGGYKGLQEDTRGYKGVTEGYRW